MVVILGLGSNVGEREQMLAAASLALAEILSDMRCSAHIETPALLKENAPAEWNMPFVNMAVCGHCDMPPRALLSHIKMLEKKLGRQDRGCWAPREIDIDILAYGDEVLNEEGLAIPHPGLPSRLFALAPFAELAPDWRWPVRDVHFGKSAVQMLAGLGA